MTLENRYKKYLSVAPKMSLREFQVWAYSLDMEVENLSAKEATVKWGHI